MSSLEEERLVQMVHDFMELETPSAPTSIPLNQEYTCLILQGILGKTSDVEMDVLAKATKHVTELGNHEESSIKKRLMMRLRMDGYDASLCRSSWPKTLDCPGEDYEYIVVAEEKGGGEYSCSCRLIVDTEFRSQFELARPTSAYTELSNALPPVFVGDEEKLKKIVSLLCSAAQKSLRESGLHIPPWRRSSYMQSKWLPCFHKASAIPLTFPGKKACMGSIAHVG